MEANKQKRINGEEFQAIVISFDRMTESQKDAASAKASFEAMLARALHKAGGRPATHQMCLGCGFVYSLGLQVCPDCKGAD
jgi:hypothetical protein